MARFDRYFLAQLLMLFGLFALILVSIFWINRAVALFDLLISSGQSALVFLEFTTLSLPAMIKTNLPLAGVVAVIWVVNRMNNESEMVVVQATGFSPWRLARPVALFSFVAFAFIMVLGHALAPISQSQLRERQAEISSDITARLLREGVFIQPSRGVTFFIEDISPNGALSEVMLTDTREEGITATYTATRASLLRQDDQTMLVLLDGLIQFLDAETGKLSTTSFDRFVFDVTNMAGAAGNGLDGPALKSSTWLRNAARQDEVQADLYRAEIHSRNGEALFTLSAILLVFSVMMAGHFRRSGMWQQIIWSIILVVFAKALDNQMIAIVTRTPEHAVLVYVGPLVTILAASLFLGIASGSFRPFNRRQTA